MYFCCFLSVELPSVYFFVFVFVSALGVTCPDFSSINGDHAFLKAIITQFFFVIFKTDQNNCLNSNWQDSLVVVANVLRSRIKETFPNLIFFIL